MKKLLALLLLLAIGSPCWAQTYESMLADADLIAYYNGDANDDGTEDFNDVQGTYNLTESGTVAYAAAPAGAGDGFAFSLNGSTNSLYSTNQAALGAAIEPAGTYCVWVKLDASQPAGNRLIFGPTTNCYRYLLTNASVLIGRCHDSVGAAQDVTGSALTQDVWYHVAYTWENGEQQLIVNGSIVDSATVATLEDNTNTASNFGIGGYASGDSGTRVKGDIYGVMIFDRALTEDEVAAIYNGPATGDPNPLTPTLPGGTPDPLKRILGQLAPRTIPLSQVRYLPHELTLAP